MKKLCKRLWKDTKNAVKKVALGAILAGAIFLPTVDAAEPNTSWGMSEIMSDGSIPTLRLESYTSGLPGNSDFYNTWENQDDSDFYLSKLRTYPLSLENFGLGLALQHVDGTNFDAHDEAGLALRFSGKPTKGSFAKLTADYFPTMDNLSLYGILDTDKVFADMLTSYNTDSKDASFRLGLDFKLPDDWAIGPEVGLSGKLNGLKKDYVGLRVKKSF